MHKEVLMQVYIGIDWSEQKHDVVFMNKAGATLAQFEIPHIPKLQLHPVVITTHPHGSIPPNHWGFPRSSTRFPDVLPLLGFLQGLEVF